MMSASVGVWRNRSVAGCSVIAKVSRRTVNMGARLILAPTVGMRLRAAPNAATPLCLPRLTVSSAAVISYPSPPGGKTMLHTRQQPGSPSSQTRYDGRQCYAPLIPDFYFGLTGLPAGETAFGLHGKRAALI